MRIDTKVMDFVGSIQKAQKGTNWQKKAQNFCAFKKRPKGTKWHKTSKRHKVGLNYTNYSRRFFIKGKSFCVYFVPFGRFFMKSKLVCAFWTFFMKFKLFCA